MRGSFLRAAIAVLAAALAVGACGAGATAEAPQPARVPARSFAGGAPSVDALLDQFLAALAANDEQALHRLRVDEAEYREIIIPGTVPPGESPRRVSAQPQEFFWRLLDTKSRDFGYLLLQEFGGHAYRRTALAFTEKSRPYAWYTAHGQVRLIVQDAEGRERVLRTGWIAEAGGTFKFIGFEWGD